MEFEMENSRYLDREVKRRVLDQMERERKRWERYRRQEDEGSRERKRRVSCQREERATEASYGREVGGEAEGKRVVGIIWYR